MRALVQRVSRAEVRLPAGEARSIAAGLLVLLGVGRGDSEAQVRRLVEKIVNLRIFSNEAGKFDQNVRDVDGEGLVVSQFTLYGDPRGGRRPDFTAAAPPDQARPLYELFARLLSEAGVPTKTGVFGAAMQVESVNEGPVTLWLDTDAL